MLAVEKRLWPRLLLGILTLSVVIGMRFQAEPVSADLPPRPAVLVDKKVTGDDQGDGELLGAHISLLHAEPGAWTVVQWQDADGTWQNVDGWRGQANGDVTWWVAEKDFGSGPFRWAIYAGQDQTKVSVSVVFNLPEAPNQLLLVTAP